MVEEDAFLKRGQRVDVLHIRGSAGNGGNDVVNLALRERSQTEQIGRDGRAAFGNEIGGGNKCGSGGLCSTAIARRAT